MDIKRVLENIEERRLFHAVGCDTNFKHEWVSVSIVKKWLMTRIKSLRSRFMMCITSFPRCDLLEGSDLPSSGKANERGGKC